MVRWVPSKGVFVTVCSPMSRPDDFLLGPVADGSLKTDCTLIFSIGNRPVEERQGFSLRLAVVELAIGVLAITIAIPVGAANFGKWFMPLVACSSVWAKPLCKSTSEEL